MPFSLRREFAAARLLGLRVRMPPGVLLSLVSVLCFNDGLVNRAEESCRLLCVCV